MSTTSRMYLISASLPSRPLLHQQPGCRSPLQAVCTITQRSSAVRAVLSLAPLLNYHKVSQGRNSAASLQTHREQPRLHTGTPHAPEKMKGLLQPSSHSLSFTALGSLGVGECGWPCFSWIRTKSKLGPMRWLGV